MDMNALDHMRADAAACNRRLAGLAAEPHQRRMAGAAIVDRVAARHGLTLADLLGQSRIWRIARARQAAYAAIRIELGWSLPRIGRLFGGRDHTTILKGIRAHERRQA
jgi:chromosomal replication initiator protein